jgi:hypothetical protein
LIEALNNTASGFAQRLDVATALTTSGRGDRTAAEPISEARIAVGPSVVLLHEQVGLDFAFVWCIGHSSPSLWEHVQAWSTPTTSLVHKDTGTRIIADAWQRSHAPTIQVTCCRSPSIGQ